MQGSDKLIGVSARSAARVAGVSERRLNRWETSGLVRPETRRDLGPRKRVRLYGFPQLVELLVVRELEDRGIHVRHLRGFVEAMRQLGHDRPLAELRWGVDGKHLYVGDDTGNWSGGRAPTQRVIVETIDLNEIRARARHSVTELREPTQRGKIEKRRGVLGSKPVFAGTRTPVTAVQAYLRRGASEREILEAFPHLTKADVAVARKEMRGAA